MKSKRIWRACLLLLVAGVPVHGQLGLFTHPNPGLGSGFGSSIVAVGNDKVLIGAHGADQAHLFHLSGHLLTTFNNPMPNQSGAFGYSLAAVGPDKVIIGAPGEPSPGAAFLFDLQGNLLRTFSDPLSPSLPWRRFGWSVAAVGSDNLVIGAPRLNSYSGGSQPSGHGYLFDLNGNLLTTYQDPARGDPISGGVTDETIFGWSVAAVGTDFVVITAPRGTGSGAAMLGRGYLFNLQGNLVSEFRPPIFMGGFRFGDSVAALGTTRVLIGAPEVEVQSDSVSWPGHALIYDLQGNLLQVLSDPTPENHGYFGISVAALGADKALVGSMHSGTTPSAYLFDLGGNVLVSYSDPLGHLYFGTKVAAAGPDRILVSGPGEAVSLFHLQDNVNAPVIDCPPDVTVLCLQDVPPPDFTGTVSDSSDPHPHVTHVQDVRTGTIPSFIRRTYRATNASGLSQTCTQTITIQPVAGDLNADCSVNRSDLDLLLEKIRIRSSDLGYDLNGDHKVDIADARFLVLLLAAP